MAPKIEKMLAHHDAGLLIGDPALQIDRSRYSQSTWPRSGFATPVNPSSSPSGQFVKKRLRGSRAITRPGSNISTIPRPRTRTRQPRSHRPRMGSAPRPQRIRHPLLPHRKYLLPPRHCLPGGPATLLSLCRRDRSAACRAADALPVPASATESASNCECHNRLAQSRAGL